MMKEVQNSDQLDEYLRKYQLDKVFHEPLRPHLTLYRLAPGDVACYQGQRAEQMYVLVQGKVKIYTNSSEGQSLIVSFKTPLEVIGDIEYVRQIEIINTVEAVSSVDLIGIPYAWLRKAGDDHPPLLHFLLDIITRKFYVKSDFLSFNLMHPVEVRLASYLLSVSTEESDMAGAVHDGSISLTDTANLIGTSYRHLNRVIMKFCSEGLVERGRGSIRIRDLEGLRAIVNGSMPEKKDGQR